MIRHVGPDQWADWRLLRRRSLVEDRAAFSASTQLWSGADDTEERWRALLADTACFIAYDGEEPVGMVSGRVVDGAHELTSMWVAPQGRGRGIGRQLIAAVIAWSAGRPLSLRVMDGNQAAIRVYEAAGFELQDGVDAEGCRRMVRAAPPFRLVAGAQRAPLPPGSRRVGLRGLLADLNRSAQHVEVPAEAATYGISWDPTDRDTTRWFPQGITTSSDAYGPEPTGGDVRGP
ncbi:GNAT family N-acetyltransferase [Aeromicrobium sp. UC242_57]|uniref:GNAT family N-acetyltransferase n=1 Tax=Aeromicrobium sp. UC242_57 TaxID=3374624 RepID=UPI00378DF5B6